MKMFEGMPESAYEFPLSDLVQQKAAMQKRSNEEVQTEKHKAEERSSGKQDKRKTSGSYINGSRNRSTTQDNYCGWRIPLEC